jgi:hypothetical protein
VLRATEEFTRRTKIDLERINQPSFRNESELASILLQRRDANLKAVIGSQTHLIKTADKHHIDRVLRSLAGNVIRLI